MTDRLAMWIAIVLWAAAFPFLVIAGLYAVSEPIDEHMPQSKWRVEQSIPKPRALNLNDPAAGAANQTGEGR